MHNILFQYIYWFFIIAPLNILKAWWNLFLFTVNYFSLPLLLKTFFSCWKKISSPYGKFDIIKYLDTFTLNLMSRFIGMIIRFFVIIFGLSFSLIVFLGGLIFFILWITMPFWGIFIFIYGIKLL